MLFIRSSIRAFRMPECPDRVQLGDRILHDHDGACFPSISGTSAVDGEYGAWLGAPAGNRFCTADGGMIGSQARGARVWMHTTQHVRTPPVLRRKLDGSPGCIDLIGSMARPMLTYAVVLLRRGGRHGIPPRGGRMPLQRPAALDMLRELRAPTRVVVSIIRQEAIEESSTGHRFLDHGRRR